MNDIEREKLEHLMEDETLVKAVRAIFDETTESYRPQPQINEPDAVLGQRYRAYEDATKIIHDSFKTLESYKKSSEVLSTSKSPR